MTTLRHNDIWRRDFDISTSLYNDISIRKWRPANIAVAFLLAAMLTGCGGSDIIDDDNNVEAPKPLATSNEEIRVNTNVTSMMTRANTIDNNTALQGYDLKIDAYYNGTDDKYLDGTKLHYTGGDPAWQFWSGSPGSQAHYYWPFEGSKTAGGATASTLDFVGFCPFEKPAYIGTPTYNHSTGVSFTCDMSSYMTLARQTGGEAPTIPTMQEFLVAVLNEQTLATQTAAVGGALPLQFKHPLAIIKFTITAASGTNVQINSISIADLYTSATCTYDGTDLDWGSHSGSAAMTVSQTLKNGGTTESTGYMIIPNNYDSKTLTVNATWDSWSNPVTQNVTADVNFNWQPGYIYTYNLTLEKYALKVETTESYTEQW